MAPGPRARTALGIDTPISIGPADGNVATQTGVPSALTSTLGVSGAQRWLLASRDSRNRISFLPDVHSAGLPEQATIVGSKAIALGLTVCVAPQPARAKAPIVTETTLATESGGARTGE
jgi:hypothetical protein